MTVTHHFDEQALLNILRAPGGGLERDMFRRGKNVEGRGKRLCPVDHGRLRSSLTTEIVRRAGLPLARVGTDVRYAIWVHEGTGLYGPRGTLIIPTHGRFLVFTPRGASQPVFARSVRGVRPRHFLKDALPAARS